MRHTFLVGSVALGIAAVSASTYGAVVISDTFSRGTAENPVALGGASPNVGAGTWIVNKSDHFQTDGSAAQIVNGNWGDTARLPFTPEAGKIYTLTVDMTVDESATGNNDGLELGFAENKTGSTYDSFSPMSHIGQNGDHKVFAGPGGNDRIDSDTGGAVTGNKKGNVNHLKLVLDTTGTQWKIQGFINDKADGDVYTYTTNPTINYVGFGNYAHTNGIIANFKLTVVPEPSSMGLLSLGGLVLLRRRRQR